MYSLFGAPSGISIDPVTGAITVDDSTPVGFYQFEKIFTDSGGNVTRCDVSADVTTDEQTVCCADDDEACRLCLETHLAETEHITMNEVKQCIAEALSFPPSSPDDCCDNPRLVWNLCGNTFVLQSFNGSPDIPADVSPKIHAYTGTAPDPAEAQLLPEFEDGTGRPLPTVPLSGYAGPPDGNGGLSCITHMSVCGQWVPVGCAGVEGAPGQVKCALYDGDVPAFPIVYGPNESIWTINGVDYQLPLCDDPLSVFAPSRVAMEDGGLGGNTDGVFDFNTNDIDVFTTAAPSTIVGGTANVPKTYAFQFDAWLGNGGALDPSTVVDITVCWDAMVDPNTIDFYRVGVLDFYGDVNVTGDQSFYWLPPITVDAPGSSSWSLANSTVGVDVDLTGGHWEATFAVPAAVWSSNSIGVVFTGLDSTMVSNIQMKVNTGQNSACTISDIDELVALLNSMNVSDTTWFVEDGEVFGFVDEGDCV